MDVRIRAVSLNDVPVLYQIVTQADVLPMTNMIPSARESGTQSYIDSFDENTHMLVAESLPEECVIASATLVCRGGRARHVGVVGIIVDAAFHGKGVGTKLFGEIVALADNFLRLDRLELTVDPENSAGIKLYEKFGFVKEGVARGAYIRDGKYCDMLYMGRLREEARG